MGKGARQEAPFHYTQQHNTYTFYCFPIREWRYRNDDLKTGMMDLSFCLSQAMPGMAVTVFCCVCVINQ
jgi:hypothetical protein